MSRTDVAIVRAYASVEYVSRGIDRNGSRPTWAWEGRPEGGLFSSTGSAKASVAGQRPRRWVVPEEYVCWVEVRTARRDDLVDIGRLAHEAWWEAYETLVSGETINAVLGESYSPSGLAKRLLRNFCIVATEGPVMVGFAEGRLEPDHVILETLYCRPEYRHDGIGSRLLDEIHGLAPELPICSDVVLGNLVSESFHESRGFAPGEVIEDTLQREPIVRRRWWLPGQDPEPREVARERKRTS